MLRILWISDSIFPCVAKLRGLKRDFGTGWIFASAEYLVNNESNISLGVVNFVPNADFSVVNDNNIKHIVIPKEKCFEYCTWSMVFEVFQPDLIHVHGSEYKHLFSFQVTNPRYKVLVSIQGIISIIGKYYLGNVSVFDHLRSITLRDLLRGDTVFSQKMNVVKRGRYEVKNLVRVDAIIGRTEWDRAHTAVLTNAKYYHCNESLREPFYQGSWSVHTCKEFRLFVSQGHYPIKGLHVLLRALSLILKEFPDTTLYVAGNDIVNRGFKRNGYGKYLKELINKLKLKNKVFFCGPLDGDNMKSELLKSHVSVTPSIIENSPNSVGEAQILGVPTVCSFVGGVSSMVLDNYNGLLYRFEEPEMLAYQVCRIFRSREFASQLSINAQATARLRHDKEINLRNLVKIYHAVSTTVEEVTTK